MRVQTSLCQSCFDALVAKHLANLYKANLYKRTESKPKSGDRLTFDLVPFLYITAFKAIRSNSEELERVVENLLHKNHTAREQYGTQAFDPKRIAEAIVAKDG